MYICTNKHKLLACIKCPGAVICPEYAGAAKRTVPENNERKEPAVSGTNR